ncbi:MAG: amidohydrolase family protein [Deltaproteobacteria bacterium]|nr:amidohydrolase family protein [Deltaproteobacteria bacterium]
MIRDRLRRWRGAPGLPSPDRDPFRLRLYSAPWVIPGDSAPIRDGAVVMDIEDGTILGVGERAELARLWAGVGRADLDGMLMPGLVNANARLELTSLTRAQVDVPSGIGLRRWLRKLSELRAETDGLDEDSRESQIRTAVRASLAEGTAAVGEITHSLRPVPAMGREGMYGVVFHELITARRMAKALAAAAVQKAGIIPWPDGVRYRLAPDGLRATAKSALKELAGIAIEAGAETVVQMVGSDDDWDLRRAGEAVAKEFLDLLHDRMLLIHPLGGGRMIAEQAASTGAPVVLCPRSDLHVSGDLPPLIPYLESGCSVALGTDSSSSSPDMSVLREAAELHAAYPEVPSMVLITAATSGGADALGLETMGALAQGRAPGLLRVDTHGYTPDDPCGWLLRAGNPDLSWLVRAAPPPLAEAA